MPLDSPYDEIIVPLQRQEMYARAIERGELTWDDYFRIFLDDCEPFNPSDLMPAKMMDRKINRKNFNIPRRQFS